MNPDAIAVGEGEQDPLSFRPNPSLLVAKDADSEEDSGTEDSNRPEGAAKDVYKVPRIAPMFYNEDDTDDAKFERRQEREREKLKKSMAMQMLRDSMSDGPKEVRNHGYGDDLRKIEAEDREVAEWEENRMMRRQVTKKDKVIMNSFFFQSCYGMLHASLY